MVRKVFVSYKYADSDVQHLSNTNYPTTVRDYVTYFEKRISNNGVAYFKGEHEGEDLSHLSEDSIWEKLKDKIYDSSVTVVFISPNMREAYKSDKQQWIPWEISFSLREQTRNGRTSHSNALLFVVLPDRNGGYFYSGVIRKFNIIQSNITNGYAEVVQWNSFISNIEYYIQRAEQKRNSVPSHKIVKSVE